MNFVLVSGLVAATVGAFAVNKLRLQRPSPVILQEPSPVPVLAQPTFSDTFPSLDTSKWIPSNWAAPGTITGKNSGVFSPAMLSFPGLLCIGLTQTLQADGSVISIGGEIQSIQKFGYGTYQWVMRQSNTSMHPNRRGEIVSGQISSGFIFNDFHTEIDFEIEGQRPSVLQLTSWLLSAKQNAATIIPNPIDWHTYKFVWAPNKIQFYLDDKLVSTHTKNIPSVPAYVMINHWGTNDKDWGGLATPDVPRYMYIKSFKFWAHK